MRWGDTAGGDAITVMDWIVSVPLLFSHHCPLHYLSLTVCLPLSSATNPGLSLSSHLQLSSIPSALPLLSFAVFQQPSRTQSFPLSHVLSIGSSSSVGHLSPCTF